MKKFLLSLLVIVLALGFLGAAAYAGYRYGFIQGTAAASDGNFPFIGRGFDSGPGRMPMHEFGLNRRFDRDNFGMMRPGFGYGFGFPLPGLLARLLFWGLIIAGLYWLITRSGWRLTRAAPVSAAASATPTVAETPPPAEENRPSDTP